MLTDIEISNNCNLRPIGEIAKKLGVSQIARINYIIPGKVCQD